jgi:Flp pilus assembly protein TadG
MSRKVGIGMMRASGRARREDGAVVVEFALIVPFLMLVLFGMVTTGFTYSDHLSITNAVREGARLASALPIAADTTNPTATPGAWATSVQTRVRDVYFNNGSTVSTSQICVKLVNSSNTLVTGAQALGADCGSEPPAPTTMVAGTCAVKVWVKKPAHIELVVAPTLNFNIGAQSVSYYGRQSGVCTAQ